MIEVTYFGDTFSIAVDVIRENGAPLDISGAAVEMAASRGGSTVNATSVTITDAPGGHFVGLFDPGALDERVWTLQARVTLGGVIQTVYEDSLTVRRSNFG